MIMVMGFECGKDHIWRKKVGRYTLSVWRRNVRSTAWSIQFQVKRGHVVTLDIGTNKTKEKCMLQAIQAFNTKVAHAPIQEPTA